MIPLSILALPALVAKLDVVVAPMTDGTIDRSFFVEEEKGVMAYFQKRIKNVDAVKNRSQFIPRGNYTWRIDEEKRVIIMAPVGRELGVKARVFILSGWRDTSRRSVDPPAPREVFRFSAPTREAAVELQNRLRRALRP